SDYGTENCTVASLQIAFHLKSNSFLGSHAYIYGPSKSNVKIEGWWSQLRRGKTSWWIDKFKRLKERGLFDGSILHKFALAYTTVGIITRELEEFKNYWNSHKLRHNRKASLPSGIPQNLYLMPHLYGAQDHIQPIDVPLWIYAMRNESVSKPDFYSNSFKEVVDNLLESSLGLKQEDITHSNIEDIYLYYCK
ncbi:PREDICTED: uncharacterized protein LOC109587956, partial [Amphimedon queenslandica]|uniref:Integrase core domain-containing protein n=2 Tax=Amphimedon queenslandica TaxID=400682 RepID=A0AAN0JRL8_AMPQE